MKLGEAILGEMHNSIMKLTPWDDEYPEPPPSDSLQSGHEEGRGRMLLCVYGELG